MRSLLLAGQRRLVALSVCSRMWMRVCVQTYVVWQTSGMYGVMHVFTFGCGCSVVCDGLCV